VVLGARRVAQTVAVAHAARREFGYRWRRSHRRGVAEVAHDFPAPIFVPDDYGVRLRRRHFPGLRRLTVYDEEYPVWVPRRDGSRYPF
jgi:hypothetical protein